ncbi:MAG: 50S ribosomal protein L13 [Candidatus Cloacimonadota bacterium]|nr:MAG: 50S ribosomal protein L13 [Candidatus Cloacimonadota bacterium]PIE79469.1 MAG: 50S ribosomal protein L13 [Candidatus Delongbacteria bacterium]
MKTFSQKTADVDRKWYLIDAEGKTLGRVATQISRLLIGKHKPTYTPHIDGGDFIVVVNSEKVVLTGNKEKDKEYFTYSGYVGSQKFTTVAEMRERHPERIIINAVKGMLPKNKLQARRLKRLKTFVGSEHTHAAQKPEKI